MQNSETLSPACSRRCSRCTQPTERNAGQMRVTHPSTCGIHLITQRSVVQIHPRNQPKLTLTIELASFR